MSKNGTDWSAPKSLFTGVYLYVALSCFMILFGTAVAESTTHGVFTNYMASVAGGLVFFFLWRFKVVAVLRGVTALIGIGALGFILAIVSLYMPSLSIVPCALLGAANMACWLNPFWGLLLAKRYPSRFITPVIIGIAFGTVLVQFALLEAFRSHTEILYVIYLLIAVALAIVYLVLEPYLLYTLRDKAPEGTKAEGEAATKERPGGVFDTLTETELKIADRIMRGYGNREIATELNYSENTIKSYRKELYAKLQIHSKRELFMLAEKNSGKE